MLTDTILFYMFALLVLGGGVLTITWAGEDQPVLMTGPAITVFAGEINI